MITMEPFSYVHALNISDIKDEEFIRTMKEHEKDASAYTVYYDNEILCCGGVMMVWEGVAEIWTLESELIHKHPLAFHKFMKKWMGIFFKKHNLVRMQATVDAGYDNYIKWIESLGFVREGLMKKFHAGRDYYLFAKVV
jgi:hypothetical protein